MRTVGVRELKQTLSQALHEVGRGEMIRVTSRGQPVADIVPAGARASDDRLRELIVEGRLVPPSSRRPPQPPRLANPSRPASGLVLSEREEP